jgi:hypothetical protein
MSRICCANVTWKPRECCVRIPRRCHAYVVQMRRASYARHTISKCDVKRAGCAHYTRCTRREKCAFVQYRTLTRTVCCDLPYLFLEPDNESLHDDLKYYEEKLSSAGRNGDEIDKPLKLRGFNEDTYYKEAYDKYYALCRGDVKRVSATLSHRL